MILIGTAAWTIRTITNIETLRDIDRDILPDAGKDLQDLVDRSLGYAGWLIMLSVGVIIAEIVAIVLVLMLAQFQALQLVIQIIVSCMYFVFL